jgi:hypothetical protein
MVGLRSRLWKLYRVARKKYKRFNKNRRRDVRYLLRRRERKALHGLTVAGRWMGVPCQPLQKRWRTR